MRGTLPPTYTRSMPESIWTPHIDRPTHSDRWHRVANLTPRLSASVRISRAVLRGEVWHIAEETTSNAFFRMNVPAYVFVSQLDGRRTVGEALERAERTLGEDTPTRGEALQVLSQLHDADLLRLETDVPLAPVVRRARKKRFREARSHLGALLFVRIPLFNPNRLLDALAPFAAPFVSVFGVVLWCVVVMLGIFALAGETERFVRATSTVLDTSNLLALYLVIAIVKAFHELGHGLSLKALARKHGGAGVYRVGVLLLLFLPFPYIDASGAWKLRSKWERALVGLAGMIVELFVAGIAALVWVRAGEGTLVAQIAFNVVLASGVSTVLFNANPLLRYDGYHVLCDLLEVPNLASRASQQLMSLVKRLGFGVRSAFATASTRAEGALFIAYALASVVYRVFLYGAIGLFVLHQQFALGVVLLLIAFVELALTPCWRAVTYLLTNAELATRRVRSGWVTVGALGAAALPALLVPLPRYARVTGVVEPADATDVHAALSAPIERMAPNGTALDAGDEVLTLTPTDLEHEATRLARLLDRLELARRSALRDDLGAIEAIQNRQAVTEDELAWVHHRLSECRVIAPRAGTWVTDGPIPDGASAGAGERLGRIVHAGGLRVRAVPNASTPGAIESSRAVRARLAGSSSDLGVSFLRVERIVPEPASADDEPVTTLLYALERAPDTRIGQRVHIRARVANATLAQRAWEVLLRVFEQRGDA